MMRVPGLRGLRVRTVAAETCLASGIVLREAELNAVIPREAPRPGDARPQAPAAGAGAPRGERRERARG